MQKYPLLPTLMDTVGKLMRFFSPLHIITTSKTKQKDPPNVPYVTIYLIMQTRDLMVINHFPKSNLSVLIDVPSYHILSLCICLEQPPSPPSSSLTHMIAQVTRKASNCPVHTDSDTPLTCPMNWSPSDFSKIQIWLCHFPLV